MANELITNKGDDFLVDFSGEGKSKKSIANRSKLTEYANTDLASGFPSNMIWTTLDGRRIAIPNLSDSHLLNILAYVRTKCTTYKRALAAQLAIKGASFASQMDSADLPRELIQIGLQPFQDKIDEVLVMDDEEFIRTYMPIYSRLYQEAYKRKILIEVDKTKLGVDHDPDFHNGVG